MTDIIKSTVTMQLTGAELYIARDFADAFLEYSMTGVPEEDAPKIALRKRFQDLLFQLETAGQGNGMNTSRAGRELIERNEGLRLDAYPDPATGGDPWTIGYGDTGPKVVPGLTITQEEASRRLDGRLSREFGAAVNKAIGNAPTTQGQFDAMVSLAYNIGVGGFRRSSVLRRHLAGHYPEAGDAFLMWNKAGGRVLAGLTRRRREERALYLSGAAGGQPLAERNQ